MNAPNFAATLSPSHDRFVERLKPIVDETISRLRTVAFREDPIAGRKYSRATSIVSSAYKRHGQILGQALLERLKECARLRVWQEAEFKLSHSSLTQVQLLEHIDPALTLHLPYGQRERAILIDMIVYDMEDRSLRSYNVKRGNGSYDGGKRKIILDELLRTNMLLADYGSKAGYETALSHAHIIFYYGLSSIPNPLSLRGDDLDSHFKFPVIQAIEEVNDYFREQLHALIEEE